METINEINNAEITSVNSRCRGASAVVLEPAADALDRYANHPFTMLCIVALRESSGNRVWWAALCAGERRFTAGASP